MKRMILLPIFLLSGCVTTDDMKSLSSGHIGCLPNEITIEDPTDTSAGYAWTAICKGKTFICSRDLTGYDQSVNCAERIE